MGVGCARRFVWAVRLSCSVCSERRQLLFAARCATAQVSRRGGSDWAPQGRLAHRGSTPVPSQAYSSALASIHHFWGAGLHAGRGRARQGRLRPPACAGASSRKKKYGKHTDIESHSSWLAVTPGGTVCRWGAAGWRGGPVAVMGAPRGGRGSVKGGRQPAQPRPGLHHASTDAHPLLLLHLLKLALRCVVLVHARAAVGALRAPGTGQPPSGSWAAEQRRREARARRTQWRGAASGTHSMPAHRLWAMIDRTGDAAKSAPAGAAGPAPPPAAGRAPPARATARRGGPCTRQRGGGWWGCGGPRRVGFGELC